MTEKSRQNTEKLCLKRPLMPEFIFRIYVIIPIYLPGGLSFMPGRNCGNAEFPPARTTYIADGMVIRRIPSTSGVSENIVWFLLSDHPKELAESSQFQKVVEWVGIKEVLPGHIPQPRTLPVIPRDEPVYVRDLERCILCERCVRMCQEVRHWRDWLDESRD